MIGLFAFLALSFGLSWGIWENLVNNGWHPGDTGSAMYLLYGAFAPALACVVVRMLVTRKGFGDAGLGLRLKHWKLYLFAWLHPFFAALVVLGMTKVSGVADVDFSFASGLARLTAQTDLAAPMEHMSGPMLIGQSMITAVLLCPILFGEEFGWRGYLQKRIFTSQPLVAAIVTGVIWGLWHLPLNLRGYNFPDAPVPGAVVFCVSLILLSIIYGWLVQASGSIWPACLAHASTNAVGASMVLLATGGNGGLFPAYLGIFGWIPLGALAAWIVATGRLNPAEPEQTEES